MMDFSEEKYHTCAFKLSDIVYMPRDVFARDYETFDAKKREQVYLQILHEVYQAVSLGNPEALEIFRDCIEVILAAEDGEKLKYFYDSKNNPLRKTNAVILACQGGSAEVIECLFANGGKLLNYTSGNFVSTPMLPNDKHGDCHNCIYYAIRSNNVKLLDTLIRKWPGDHFLNHPEDMDEVISKAYKELKMKNLLLSTEMIFFVESTLIELRSLFDDSKKSHCAQRTREIIEGRIDLLLKYIKILKEGYLKERKVDEKFLCLLKFIASNIHILKSQLKSTYVRIPWEEMEFCIVCFVLSRTTKTYLNLYFLVILKEEKLLRQLESFSECLENEMNNIKNADVNKLRKSLKLERKTVVADISSRYPLFVVMYDDYERIRDVYSMVKMKKYVDLAVEANCREKEDRLVVTRCLQVVGEHLKNTLESPKLSDKTRELLLLRVSPYVIEILTGLRNSLSHAESLSRRAEINEEYFSNIQDDIKKLGSEIVIALMKRETYLVRNILEKLVQSEGFEEAERIKEISKRIGPSYLSGVTLKKTDFIEEVIVKLNDTIGEKTIYEKELFKSINELIISEKECEKYAEFNGIIDRAEIERISNILNEHGLNTRTVRSVKTFAKLALNSINPTQIFDSDLRKSNLTKLASLLMKVFSSAEPRMKDGKRLAIFELKDKCDEFFCLKLEKAKWIERFQDKIFLRVSKKDDLMNRDKLVSLLKEDTLLMQNILKRHDLSVHQVESIASNIRNTKLQAVLEMLLLDIMSILDNLKETSDHNPIFLDDDLPLLMGRFLRNHLAHSNILMDLLCNDPTISLVSNALKMNPENVIERNKKTGKLNGKDLLGLGNRINQDIEVILNQESMFAALEEGNYEELIACVNKGADIWARNHNMWTSLHFAVKGQSLEIVKYLLDNKLNVDAKDINGQSPLHVAAHFGKTSIAELIIQERSIDCNVRDTMGKTALDVAAANGHMDMIELLLKHSSTKKCTSFMYNSPVYHAVYNNQFDVVVRLLEREENVDATHCRGGFTLLYTAAEKGFVELVNYLLKRNASPNSRSDKRGTPLHSAALYGYLDVVKTLVMHGADVNARDINDFTPLHNAVEYNNEEIAKFLLEHGARVNTACKFYRDTPLHLAAMYGYTGIVNILLMHKANIISERAGGMSPILVAALKGHCMIVDILIKKMTPVNISNPYGQTALHLSCLRGHEDIVNILLSNGARLNDEDEKGRCPLHMASILGNARIVEVLISRGAEVNAKTIDGLTPLHFSAFNNHKDVLKMLLHRGAFIDSKNKLGFTPLHLAVYGKVDRTVVEYLISKGADVNAESITGMTPLHNASLYADFKVIEALLEAGAKINAENHENSTPLHLSVARNRKDIVEYFMKKGANVNSGSENDCTPLIGAVRCNYHEIAKILVENGADVNVGRPLHIAVEAGYEKIVRLLLQQKNIDCIGSPGLPVDNTLLHKAVVRGRAKVVEALLAKGTDTQPITGVNITPLDQSVYEGNVQITEILLKNGANVNDEFINGTALHIAAVKGNSEMVDMLLRCGADVNVVDSKKRTPLQLAVAYNRVKVVELLKSNKQTDIHCRDKLNWNLLHIAASKGHLDMVKLLFGYNVDASAENDCGSKPIHLAARDGHMSIVDFFLSNGMDINVRGYLGSQLLYYAAQGKSIEVARYLLAKDCDVNAVNEILSTPLHCASILGNFKVLNYLLRKGATYNSRDIFRKRPLDLSCDPETTKLLKSTEKLFAAVKGNNSCETEKCIKQGAFIDARRSDHSTVLHLAACEGYDNLVCSLLKNNANPNAIGKNGYTPLHYAAKFGHIQITKSLLSHGGMYNPTSVTCKTPLDFAGDKNIESLLELVDLSFKRVETGNENVIEDLKEEKDSEKLRAIMNCCNRDGISLMAHAVRNNFPKINELKQILLKEFSLEIEAGKLMLHTENFEISSYMLEKVFQEMKLRYGPNNLATLEIQNLLANLKYNRKDFKEALSIRQEIYERQKTLFGAKCKDTLSSKSFIALILHRLGKDDEALDLFEEVYSEQKVLLGESDPDTLDTQYHMALSLNRVGRFDEAYANNVKYYEHMKVLHGEDSACTIVGQNNVAMSLSGLGKHEEALQAYKDVLIRKRRVFGCSHSTTLRTLNSIAGVLWDQSKFDECLEVYQEAYKLQREALGEFHCDTLHTQFMIGELLYSQGNYVGALEAYREGLDRRKEILGSDHVEVLTTEIKLDAIKMLLKN